MSANSMKPPTPSPPLLNYQSSKSPPKVPPNFKSSDFVSKLLAATPPYLYNIPLMPQNFFFSEMLKSFVHARNLNQTKLGDSAGILGNPTGKKGRKRLWQDMTLTNNNYLQPNCNKDVKKSEPLELTKSSNTMTTQTLPSPASHQTHAFKKLLKKNKTDFGNHKFADLKQEVGNQNVDPAYNMMPPPIAASVPHVMGSNPGLNQTMPVFNPALGDIAGLNKFSPFWNYWNNQQNNLDLQNQLQGAGFDPLHFFIDLRVSGHIYDKKVYAEGVNANEPLNLQKQDMDSIDEHLDQNENNREVLNVKTDIEDDKKTIKQENEAELRDKEAAAKESICGTNEDLKRNSAFEVPNNNNDIENQNITDGRTIKGNLKNKAKTNYGINYILNNLPKIYNNCNPNGTEDIDSTTDSDESKNKDLKYLKSYHNNLRCNKDVFTFQNNYEQFSKLHEIVGEATSKLDECSEPNKETMSAYNDKADYAAQLHVNKDSSDDEEIFGDIRNDFVDVENSESDIEDTINTSEEDLLRQEI